MRNIRAGAALIAALITSVVGANGAPSGAAGFAQTSVVDATPSKLTPDIDDGTVYALAATATSIVAGGVFTQANDRGSSTIVNHKNILAFDSTTGMITPTFAPTLDGQVQSLAAGPTPGTVYVGGTFTVVNGVKSRGITLLDATTGAIVPGFKPAVLNGNVRTIALSNGHLYVGGTFTTAGGVAHAGIAALDPITGALDPFMNIQLIGHHGWTPTNGGAQGGVGAVKFDVSPDGSHGILIGNFTQADGLNRNQVALIDLSGAQAAVDPNWATLAYTALCFNWSFDVDVTDAAFSPDGSYFVISATGGSGTNSDGTRSLCDSASRWEANATGTNVRPTWVDYTGQDTLWSIAATGTAVYTGGHQRWMNNSDGFDRAAQGAVPRPGIAALDPQTGVPLAWNPGRNPRGAGCYAILATADGLYIGSDTEFIGNSRYHYQRVNYFPLAGGETVPTPTTADLPTNVYIAGQLSFGTGSLNYRAYDGSTVGATTAFASSGFDWNTVRGAFVVNNTLFYGDSDGSFYKRSFDGTTLGDAESIDPYDDPAWSDVQTGSGQTYQGVMPTLYSQLDSVTGMFYSSGRLYYTLSGNSNLFWRWFSPESGIIGSQVQSISGVNFRSIAGMFYASGAIYFASRTSGTLSRVQFSNGTLTPSSLTSVSGPKIDGNDWSSRGLFTYGTPN